MYDDLLVIRTANADDKQALVDDEGAVLHHRPLQRLQRRARTAVAARRDQPWRARRGDHRGLARGRAPQAGDDVSESSRQPRPDAPSTRPGSWPTTSLVAVRDQDAYANLVLPALLRERTAERARRGLRHRARLRHAPRSRGVRRRPRPPARRPRHGRPAVRDALAPRCPPAAGECGCPTHAAVASTVDLVRRGSGTGRRGSPTRVLRGRRRVTWTPGWTRSTGRRLVGSRRRTHPGGWSTPSREALGAAGGARRAARGRQRAAPGHPRRAAGPGKRRGAGRGGRDPLSSRRYAVELRGDPGEIPAVARGSGRRAGRGSQLVALALARAPLEGRDGAGSTSARARWQGGAARRAGGRARGEPRGRRACSPTGPASSAGPARDHGRGAGRRRHPTGLAAGSLRPGARRRALHRPRGAAAPTRGALASTARGRRRARAAAARSARRCARRVCGPAEWSPTRPARRTGRETAGVVRAVLPSACRRTTWTTPGRCSPRPRTQRRRTWPAPSSCGRTGTEPTPCSSPCCAGWSPRLATPWNR